MTWVDIKTERPTEIPQWYLNTHSCYADETTVLVFGWDYFNYMPRYVTVFINYISDLKPDGMGRYVFEELIITHWMKLERPK